MARVEGTVLYSQVCVCRDCGFTGTEHNDFESEPMGEPYLIGDVWGEDEVASCPGCGGFHVEEVCDVLSARGDRLLAQFRKQAH